MAELAAMMFDRSYKGSQKSPYFQGMSPEEYDEELRGMPPEEFYRMVSRGIDNPQRFYEVVSQYSSLPDKAKAAMKPPTDVYSDLANRIIYSGAELLTTQGQGTAFDEAIELARLIEKYPDAVTSTRGGFEGTVDAVDVRSPSQTMTPIKRMGLPKADAEKSLHPVKREVEKTVRAQQSAPAPIGLRKQFPLPPPQNQIIATDQRQLQEMLLDERKKGREAVRVMKADQQMKTGASPDYDVVWDEKRKQWVRRDIPQEEVDRYRKENRIFVTPRISF